MTAERSSLCESLRQLLTEVEGNEYKTRTPWATPLETGDYGERQPVDHEGCTPWPWRNENEMHLAYWLRNHASELLAVLEGASITPGASLWTARDARAAIERERETRHWTIPQFREAFAENWPRESAQITMNADAAVDWFAEALDQLRSAWNAHFENCPAPGLNIPPPTWEQLRSWMDAPSGTASAE